MDKFNVMHAKVLYLRFAAIYDHKFVKTYHDEDFKSLWYNEWCVGLEHVSVDSIKDALDYCRKNLEWPPSIAEFVKICESCSGMPSLNQCIQSCVRKEFTHPLVLLCYQKVGSWAISHDTESVLESRFKSAYAECLTAFRENQESQWLLLESHNAKPPELPPPSKIPTTSESKAFREAMNRCQEILKGKKIEGGGKTYREYDKNKINQSNKDFGAAVFKEYKDYLMSIPETETMTLLPDYAYDRSKFLNEKSQKAWLLEQGYFQNNQRASTEQTGSGNNGPTKVYKTWMND